MFIFIEIFINLKDFLIIIPFKHCSDVADQNVQLAWNLLEESFVSGKMILERHIGTNSVILGVSKGKDGCKNYVYQVQYKNDDNVYDVEDLQKDYQEGNLRFDDL